MEATAPIAYISFYSRPLHARKAPTACRVAKAWSFRLFAPERDFKVVLYGDTVLAKAEYCEKWRALGNKHVFLEHGFAKRRAQRENMIVLKDHNHNERGRCNRTMAEGRCGVARKTPQTGSKNYLLFARLTCATQSVIYRTEFRPLRVCSFG